MSSAEIGAARAAAEGAAAEIEAIAAAHDDNEAETELWGYLADRSLNHKTEISGVYRARYRLDLLDPAEAPRAAALVFDESHRADGAALGFWIEYNEGAGVEKIIMGYRSTRLVANAFAKYFRALFKAENMCAVAPPRTAHGVAESAAAWVEHSEHERGAGSAGALDAWLESLVWEGLAAVKGDGSAVIDLPAPRGLLGRAWIRFEPGAPARIHYTTPDSETAEADLDAGAAGALADSWARVFEVGGRFDGLAD